MMYNNHAYSRVPRTWLIFSQILGTIVSVIGLVMFIYYMQDISLSLSNDELTKKAIIAGILAGIVYFVWRSIYTAFIIIRLANKSSDQELCANRYIISALSLGVGGFFTPFLVTAFPNVDTTSTIKPRYFLSKTMGFCTLIGAPILAFSYFLALATGANSLTNLKLIFDPNSAIKTISILMFTISAVIFAFGLLTTLTFFPNKINNTFEQNNASKLAKVISTIWMAVLTIELLVVILFAIVRLINALYDVFANRRNGNGFLAGLFAITNLLITFSYTCMVFYVTTKTISGLWSIDGVVTIKRYEHNKYAKSQLASNTNG